MAFLPARLIGQRSDPLRCLADAGIGALTQVNGATSSIAEVEPDQSGRGRRAYPSGNDAPAAADRTHDGFPNARSVQTWSCRMQAEGPIVRPALPLGAANAMPQPHPFGDTSRSAIITERRWPGDVGVLDRERIVARAGFNRWL